MTDMESSQAIFCSSILSSIRCGAVCTTQCPVNTLMSFVDVQVLFSFKQSSDGESGTSASSPVTSMSFRTDAAADRFPYLVSAGTDGRLFVWHLGCPDKPDEPRRLMWTMDDAHCKCFC
jgi:hypothetical protein